MIGLNRSNKHCQVNGVWVALGVPLSRAGGNKLGRLRTNSMAEAGDTDLASLARRLNLTIPLPFLVIFDDHHFGTQMP